jgi:hypothetical protein
VRADDAKTVALKLLHAVRFDEKGDVATGLCKPRSKVAPDRAGTDNKNLHEGLSKGLQGRK